MARPWYSRARRNPNAAAIARAMLGRLPRPAQSAAATLMARDANNRALGAPRIFNSGTTARHADAPPARSAPYNVEIRVLDRGNKTENNKPARTKGSAVSRQLTVSLEKF